MKIGLIAAMDKERRLLRPLMEECREEEYEGLRMTIGRIGQHEAALVGSGIGKVNAAVTTHCIIRSFKPDLVINSGVAGGCDPAVKPLDLVVATGVTYHDTWCGPGTEYGSAPGLPVEMIASQKVINAARLLEPNGHIHFGLICSGDKFISMAEEVAFIKDRFADALAVDMESGAIAQVCCNNGVQFGVIRVISDTPGSAENIAQYEDFWQAAPMETFYMVREVLEKLS